MELHRDTERCLSLFIFSPLFKQEINPWSAGAGIAAVAPVIREEFSQLSFQLENCSSRLRPAGEGPGAASSRPSLDEQGHLPGTIPSGWRGHSQLGVVTMNLEFGIIWDVQVWLSRAMGISVLKIYLNFS